MASLRKRGDTYCVSYYIGGKELPKSLRTDSYQIAKEKLRQFESAQLGGDDSPLATKTPIGSIVAAYVDHIRTVKTAKSAQTDIHYLRDAFGPVCEAVQITSRKASAENKKRPPKAGQDRRRRAQVLTAQSFEQITTADISEFICAQVQNRGLAPKTANRYREILCRLFNWSMEQRAIRMPGGKNPAAKVERYKERAPEIRFLTLAHITEQLAALNEKPQIQLMVAMLIYAGLRREELLWLTNGDIDLSNGTFGVIRIRAKTIEGESWQSKTKTNRAVPISSTLRRYLDRHTRRTVQGGWFFPSPQGKRYDPDNFSHDLRALNAPSHLPWGCLDFRHTFGSQLAMKGESLFKISALMGNSPGICQRHYAALLPEALYASVEFPKAL